MIKFDILFDPSSRWYYPSRICILFFLGLAIYYQSFAFDFVFDDKMFIVNNPYIKDFKDIHLMWVSFPKTRLIGTYSFALNYFFGQLDPRGYHIFNFVIHWLTTGLVWALTRTLFKVTGWLSSDGCLREELPFIIALLFLVHPCQTQAVTYISQRFESMAAMFYFAAIYCYLQGRIASINKHKIFFLAAAGLLAFLGILTKETAATIPAMVLAVELIILNKYPLNFKKFSTGQLYLLITILGLIFIFLFLKIVRLNFGMYLHYTAPSESHDGDMITSGKYVLTQMRVFLTFLRLLIFPVHQTLDYDYPLSTGLLHPPLTLVGLGLIGFIIFLIIRLRQQWPLIAFGLAWILITFSINTAPRINVIFEHKLYLISFGFFLAAVSALSTVIKDRRILLGVLITFIALLSLVSYQRNHVWKNELTLWNDIVVKSPHKARPYNYRGVAYSNNGDLDCAVSDFTRSIEIDPKLVESYNDRAGVYFKQGKLDLAIADYNKAIEIEPTLIVPYFNRGLLYINRGDFTQAISDFTKVVEIKPKFIPAYTMLAELYCQLKEYDKAWAYIYKIKILRGHLDPRFINMLKKFSGRDR